MPNSVPPRAGPPRILVVDDHPANLLAIEGILETLDVEMVRATSGREALARATGQTFALVLLDAQMPGMDGFETARQLHALPGLAELPILFLTADEDQVHQGYAAGAVDYLVKPVNAEILRAKVRIFLALHRKDRELKALADALQRQADAVQVANRELESFSYSVSHDLRAPLRSIDGFSHALLEDFGALLPKEGHEFLSRIRASVQRMGQLIDDLLQLSRVSRGELSREPVDLSALARDIADELSGASPDRKVTFEIAAGLTAEGDARLLRIALENLLGNAWKFTARTPDARIGFSRADGEEQPAFVVRDNGAGFDMTYANKLFGAFQRLHSDRDFPGTGIGLATVQRIVFRHGGKISAEGAPGKGATFRFTLPQASEPR